MAQRRDLHSALRLLALGTVLCGPVQAAAADLADIPFWKLSQGWWKSENTYFSPTLDYNIRSYNSLVHIELKGRRVVETEYKFYAPSKLAMQHGAGQAKEGEGVEMVTVVTYEQIDDRGSVRQVAAEPQTDNNGHGETVLRVLNEDTAQRVVRDPAEPADTYRMLFSLPTPDKRYIANYGLHGKPVDGVGVGELRGFSTFNGTRVKDSDFEAARAALRKKNNVHAIVTAGADRKPVAKRLD